MISVVSSLVVSNFPGFHERHTSSSFNLLSGSSDTGSLDGLHFNPLKSDPGHKILATRAIIKITPQRISTRNPSAKSRRIGFDKSKSHFSMRNEPRRRITRFSSRLEDGKSDSVEEPLLDGHPESSSTAETSSSTKVVVIAAVTMVFAVANRVLYKMALVPLARYPFFLAQLTTFGYVGLYFLLLLLRVRSGLVTRDMLELPKGRFAAMGGLESLGLASGMAAAAVLPGALIPVLTQLFLVWQLLLSFLLLGKRYSPPQLLGSGLVLAGVTTVVASGSGATSALSSSSSVGLFWPAVLAISTLFPALSSILKEATFKEAAATLPGGSLDLFVVNSFSSGFQALFVLLLLPLLSRLSAGIPLSGLPVYLREGAGCFLNSPGSIGCDGAPLLPLLYVAANLAFNISALQLLKSSSAVVASLAVTLAVPITIFVFTLPLPFLGQPKALPPGFFVGTALLLAGLAIYNFWESNKAKAE